MGRTAASVARSGLVVLAVLALVFAVACSSKHKSSSATGSPVATTDAGQSAPSSSGGSSSSGSLPDVAAVVHKAEPAVVQITTQTLQPGQFSSPFAVPSGVGSGIIIDSQGHILTNNHVIEGAQNLLVSLPDGRSFPGTVVGADPVTDLAVVQIKANNLPVAELGDSNKLQSGDWVVAIGNALGLQGGPTVTVGVVSAVGRAVQEPPASGGSKPGPFLVDMIQTSAPINPGNSGGPLINLSGQVIGINTLVAGQAEPGVQAQGIGFAIASSRAKPIADELIANGKVQHAFLGITYVPLNPALANQLGAGDAKGYVVEQVASGSPAADAGLRPRDIITQVDGKDLQGDSGLAQALDSHKPGDKVSITIRRGSSTTTLNATLGVAPS